MGSNPTLSASFFKNPLETGVFLCLSYCPAAYAALENVLSFLLRHARFGSGGLNIPRLEKAGRNQPQRYQS